MSEQHTPGRLEDYSKLDDATKQLTFEDEK